MVLSWGHSLVHKVANRKSLEWRSRRQEVELCQLVDAAKRTSVGCLLFLSWLLDEARPLLGDSGTVPKQVSVCSVGGLFLWLLLPHLVLIHSGSNPFRPFRFPISTFNNTWNTMNIFLRRSVIFYSWSNTFLRKKPDTTSTSWSTMGINLFWIVTSFPPPW